jgi:hypothetical protein
MIFLVKKIATFFYNIGSCYKLISSYMEIKLNAIRIDVLVK